MNLESTNRLAGLKFNRRIALEPTESRVGMHQSEMIATGKPNARTRDENDGDESSDQQICFDANLHTYYETSLNASMTLQKSLYQVGDDGV